VEDGRNQPSSLDLFKEVCLQSRSLFGVGKPMTALQFHDVEYWRARADEALAQARQMSDVEAKRSLLAIAENYEQLAEQAAGRGTTEATKPLP
jgi:hypothetical protein